MCGIVGYKGNKHPKDILINGLKSLEYRGYDSCGIALKNDKSIQIIKSVGKISNLEEKLKSKKLIDSTIGIAHTRWATHGKCTITNAHPHRVGRVTLVHNGIIENANEIRNMLIKSNVTFKSETDTEVIAALIDYYYNGDIIKAINKTISMLKGSYALCILISDDNNLYAVKKGSPLVLGVGIDGYYIASDLMAISNYIDKYTILEDNEVVIINGTYKIIKNNKKVSRSLKKVKKEININDKCGYKHYMLKEIYEEPALVYNLLNKYLNNLKSLPDLSKYEVIHIIGCGSALYAGMIGKNLLEEYTNLEVYCDIASEYRYRNIKYSRKTLVILISQSGETADTIAALKKAKENNVDTLGIVNVETSTIARECNNCLFIEAGAEVAVATTKAYILQVLLLSLIAYKTSKINDNKIIKEFELLPKLLREVLDNKPKYDAIAKKIYKSNNIFFIGRKIDYSMCLEGSLKLKEISYIHSEAKEAGELKHGTISLIDNNTPVISIITDNSIFDKTMSNIEEVKSRGAKVVIISNKKIDNSIYVHKLNQFCQSILVVPILQLISYEVARLRKCDIDKPRNLAKSVTVE